MYPNPILMGTISKNMCQARMHGKPKKMGEKQCCLLSSLLEDEGVSKQKQELVLLVSVLGHQQNSKKRTETILFMNRAYHAHPTAIKRVLTREFAMSIEDIQVFEKATLLPGFVISLHFPLPDCPLSVSILPSLSQGPTYAEDSLSYRHTESGHHDLVPWSIFHWMTPPSYQRFALDANLSYTEFLISYCTDVLHQKGRIDYHIYLCHNPVIFGLAHISCENKGESHTFFFSRILCSKEMSKLYVPQYLKEQLYSYVPPSS